jgi:hypothetical protein
MTKKEINYVNNNVYNTNFYDNDEYCIIDEEQFNKINSLYKFSKRGKYYIDYKRNKTVATVMKSLLDTNKRIYNFNYNWLKKELLCTGSHTLLDIVKNDPQFASIEKAYEDKKKKEKYYLPLNDFTALNFDPNQGEDDDTEMDYE